MTTNEQQNHISKSFFVSSIISNKKNTKFNIHQLNTFT